MEENIEFFELNNSVLDDFDNLMKIHLDKVEHLKIDKDIKNSKLFNIIGLCFNLKILEIEADFKTDVNKIFASICKPDLLEKVIIKNSKVPVGKFLNKFKNIKTINLENIKHSEVCEFFKDLGNDETLEKIHLENVDLENNSIEIFNRFNKLKEVKLLNLSKVKMDNLEFLNRNLDYAEIRGNKTYFNQINNLINGKYEKKIDIKLESITNIPNSIKIDNCECSIKINAEDLEKLVESVKFYRLTNLKIIFNEETNFEEFIKILKNVKHEVIICILDVSALSKEQVKILKDRLKIKYISIIDSMQNEVEQYDIKTFLSIREEIDNLVNQVPSKVETIEKYLWIYKNLLKNISYEENSEENYLVNGLINKKSISKGYAEILNNCLKVMGFETQVINGKYKKEDKNWYWVQVKIDNNWYNSDLALDAKDKKKMKNCLVTNEKMQKKYEFSNSNYCVENYNYKEIIQFWKKDKITKDESKIKSIVEKLKLLFSNNKLLEAPEVKEEKNDTK